jgi:hypothetical protein
MNACHLKIGLILRRAWFSALLMLPMLAAAQPQIIEFALPTFSAYENGTNAIVVVSRTGGAAGTVTVNYTTIDGSALSIQD